MRETAEHPTLSPKELKHAWRIVTWAGFLGSTYGILCISGAPRIKYLTELKATASDFGFIGGLGAFAIAFQIVGSVLNNQLVHRKRLWMTVTITHRLLFTGVLVAPLLFTSDAYRLGWIILFFFLHDSLAQVSGPIWLSWMADILPKQTMTRHWATRQRFITAANILVMVLLAFAFAPFEASGKVIPGFTILAAIGIVFGVCDISMFTWVPEPPNEKIQDAEWLQTFLQPLRDKGFRPFLYFIGYYYFFVFFAGAFFGLYQIAFLGLSVKTVQLLQVAGAVGVVVSSRYWGLLCDTYGYRPILQILAFAKIFVPFIFFLTPRHPTLAIPLMAFVVFFDGLVNSGFGLAMQGVLLKSTPRRNRAMYIAAVNFLGVGVMAGIAPILAGPLIDFLNQRFVLGVGMYQFTGYHVIFLLGAVLLGGAYRLAGRIQESGNVPLRTVLGQMKSFDSVRVMRWVYRLHDGEDEGRRLQAARALGRLRNPMAIGELITALQDSSRRVREAAADSLGKVGVSEATEPLARALFDGHSGIQPRAARALGRIGGPDSLKALLANLRNQDPDSLVATIDSLARIGDHAAVVPLICLFHDIEDDDIRQRITGALVKLSETESREEILYSLLGRRPLGQRIPR